MVERWFHKAKPMAETKASQRVRYMILVLNSWGSSEMAGEPSRNRMMPPKSRAKPEPALEPIVGFILPKMMMPMAPNSVDVRINTAPRIGLLAPLPGE